MVRQRRIRQRNPVDPEHQYIEAVGMVTEAFEECTKKIIRELYKHFGQGDNDIVQAALHEGHDEFVDEWQLR